MISHGDKCARCGGKMTAPKPVQDGPHKGENKNFCLRCGHAFYHRPPAQAAVSRGQSIFGPDRH